MNLKDITLLIVDDDADMRDVIAHDFRRRGFNVLIASDGARAFDLIRINKVDLVLSDVHMPGVDGIELFKKIKRHQPLLKIIFITGCSNYIKERLTEMGATYVFSKPFKRKDIFFKVIEIVSQRVKKP
jgi:CheY-like chemotaxis protein